MTALVKVRHSAIGVEVRRGTYDVVLDGECVGTVAMNTTFEVPVEPGRHRLQVRYGRQSSPTATFEATEGRVVSYRCTGKSFLPVFLASFFVPRWALHLSRQADERTGWMSRRRRSASR